MLELTLIRHAKSDWSDPVLNDFDRPLNRRGLDNAPMMGRILRERGMEFDHVVSSPAQRAIITARLITAELGYPESDIATRDDIYEAAATTLLYCVRQLPADATRCALVGHNPGITEFCNMLTGERIANLPTCAVAVIGFELDDWRAVDADLGRLLRFDYPKKYADRLLQPV